MNRKTLIYLLLILGVAAALRLRLGDSFKEVSFDTD